jgi:uncharacterized protein
MPASLPLFPLGTVLCPGVALPLHIFEPRYRTLISHLLDGDGPQQFGVVAIRQWYEVGAGPPRLHDVGCTAELRSVRELPDGRFDIDTVGRRRFRLGALDASEPYLQASVEFLDEDPGSDAAGAALAATAAWRGYRLGLAAVTGDMPTEDLTESPRALGYALTCAGLFDLVERQLLLAADDDTARLRLAASLLRREAGLLTTLRAMPDPSLLRERPSMN